MTKRIYTVICLVMLVACDPKARPAIATECDPAQRDWILQCIEKANPHSDEEPEDNTAQCENTAARLFCGTSCFVSLDGPVVCHTQESWER